jgi:hypothetical protein
VLVVILVKVVPAGLAVVANVLVVVADGKAVKVTIRELGPVLGRVGRVVARVLLWVKEIKRGALEGSVKGGVFLW